LKNVEASIQRTKEGGAGGKRMVEEGVVDLSPPAQHAFGIHVWPTLPTGSIATRPGPILTAAENFLIEIVGREGRACGYAASHKRSCCHCIIADHEFANNCFQDFVSFRI